jgi:hypothetical protein
LAKAKIHQELVEGVGCFVDISWGIYRANRPSKLYSMHSTRENDAIPWIMI